MFATKRAAPDEPPMLSRTMLCPLLQSIRSCASEDKACFDFVTKNKSFGGKSHGWWFRRLWVRRHESIKCSWPSRQLEFESTSEIWTHASSNLSYLSVENATLFGPNAVELEFLCHTWHDLSCRWFEMTKIEPEQECPNLERSVMERHIKATLPLSLSRLPLSQPLSQSPTLHVWYANTPYLTLSL